MRQPAGWLVTLSIGTALVLLLLCVLVFPRLLHPPLSARALQGVASVEKRVELQQAQARLQDDVRATLLQGVGGLLLVAGVIATWRQLQVSREGQITERFTRAIDHLGSTRTHVRLGGIYALERIANDSPADRRTVTEVLAALVRSQSRWMVGTPDVPEHPSPEVDEQLPWLEHRAIDVHTAMLVLGRRPPSPDPLPLFLGRVDLRYAHLPNARLPSTSMRHANLARVWMPGVDLDHSDLTDADLRQANLQRARLTNANLHNAHLQATDRWRVDLQGADLRGATLQGADLRGATLRAADLRGANLHGALLEGTDLTDVHADATTVWPDGFERR